MRNERLQRSFKSINEQGTPHAFTKVPSDLKNLMLIYLSDAYRQEAETRALAEAEAVKKKVEGGTAIRLVAHAEIDE